MGWEEGSERLYFHGGFFTKSRDRERTKERKKREVTVCFRKRQRICFQFRVK